MQNLHTPDEMKQTGVYKITCLVNNKFYIGSASSSRGTPSRIGFNCRIKNHIRTLNNNKHRNIILQNSWNKYGYNNFKFEILEFCSSDECMSIEQKYLDTLTPFGDNGFNICKNSLMNKSTTNKPKNRIISQNRDIKNLNSHLKIPICQYDKNHNFIKEWEGINYAAKSLNIMRQNIKRVLKDIDPTAGGYYFRYKYPQPTSIKQSKFNIKVIDIKTNEINIYATLKSIEKDLNYCKSTISIHANTGGLLGGRYLLEKLFI